ncbi:hypothetical protein [Burkholderia pseudomallei]|uniref:hypothetical protein n=1 Tax=Burkholderia pseudomallei TaxID=28450 RepID=UPI0016177F71|nr:hypothetical protein [Burkholderia pseudomallei]
MQDIIQALDVPRKLRNNTTSCALQQTGSVERANVPMPGRLIVDLIVEKQKTPQIIDFTGFFANPGGERGLQKQPQQARPVWIPLPEFVPTPAPTPISNRRAAILSRVRGFRTQKARFLLGAGGA